MQSRLVLRHCFSVNKYQRRHDMLSIPISSTSSSAAATRAISSTSTNNFITRNRSRNRSRNRYEERLNSYHNSCHRFVQTSSTSKYPADAASPSPSSTSPPSLSSSSSSSSSGIYDEVIGDEDQVLKLTNASIQRLLQDELLAIEATINNVNVSSLDNIHQNNSNTSGGNNIDMNTNMGMNMNGSMGNLMEEREEDEEMNMHDIKEVLKQQQQQHQNNTNNTNNTNKNKQTMSQLLKNFNPQNPPPPTASHSEIQTWLECSAQQESIQKYESMIENTKERQDYTSLSNVQKHLLSWYNPLRQRIQKEQEGYYEDKRRKKGSNKYGPFLCTLQAEKLAILTTHEATMFSLIKGANSATLVAMALKVADAVEAEVNVQRLLKKRMDEKKQSIKDLRKQQGLENDADSELDGNNVNDFANTGDNVNVDTMEQELSYMETLLMNENTSDSDNNDTNIDNSDKNQIKNKWMYGPSHLQRFIDELNRNDPTRKGKVRIQRANRRAMQLLDSVEPWTTNEKVILGVVLIQMLIETARVDLRGTSGTSSTITNDDEDSNNHGVPAFVYEKKWLNEKRLVGCVQMNEEFYKMIVEDKFTSLDAYTSRHKPMVLPPINWTDPNNGGYTILKTDFMRTRGCQLQKDALKQADLSIVMDGLNVLGQVPWVINKNVLAAAEKCWNDGIVLGDIPSHEDYDLPDAPVRPEGNNKDYKESQGEFQAYREALVKYRRIHQKNMDLRSLRCSAMLKLNQADQYKNFEKIYFPYNVDFRGRAYPVPPHLSNIGSDLCRGMLTFSESKPLGKRGLYWLKVHLANLAGNDKISFDDRADFTEKNMDNVRDCVNDPFGNNQWWMTLDDPFQAMATCHEIVAAIDSGSPETFESSLPVHMDGSCNGLQHYAALGRDYVGGKAVNLCPFDKPQDVYSGVMEEVIKRVAEESERLLEFDTSNPDSLTKNQKKALSDHRAARLVNGLIDRGVVKRTVMTSVYGVTYIGAKKQIQEKIEEKLEAKGVDVDEMATEIYASCGYLATVTMDVMGDLFQGARQTMRWLATCANLISSQGQPVSWISPTGVPAVQPYRQKQAYTIVTLLQTVVLINNSDNLPIHKNRQTSAFPPNYIHSLDSAHMLLTAIEMDKRGLSFSAVHDSFWTHAADIDEMNDVLRCCFIDLYNKPLLEDLKQTWELQYPSLDFPDLPERGNLDLSDVRKAPYFFQ